MRVLILLLLLSILLAWCGNDNVKLKGYQHTIKTGSLNLKSDVELDKNKSHSGTVDVTNTSMSGRKLVENKFQQNNQYTAMDDDIKKFTKLSSLLTWSGWYKINCKKEFVTERMRKECQLKQLEELSYLCDIPELWINLSNISHVINCKPDMVCVMSGIISSDDISGAIKKYRSLINDPVRNG